MNNKTILNMIISHGYGAPAAAGILGNWIAEGILNPDNVALDRQNVVGQNVYHEVGAIGFTNGSADWYLKWCAEQDKKWDVLENQVEFALTCMVVDYYKYFCEMGLWRYFEETGQYLNCYKSLEEFKSCTDKKIAAISFSVIWWSPTYKQIHGNLTWASRDSGKYELTFEQRLQQEVRDRTKYAVQVYEEYLKEVVKMKDYLQSDPKWANKPYAGETMAAAGCGPTSVADVISLVCDADPWDVAQYITKIGGASNGYGTFWEGITCAVQHFGMECKQLNSSSVYGVVGSDAEKEFLQLLITGDYVGILLMGNGFFAKSGHYIAVKYVDGKFYIAVLDVAYSPRSVCVHWTEIAPANAPGNAVGISVPFFTGKVKVFYAIKKTKPETKPVVKTEPTSYVATFRQISPGDKNMPEIYIWEEFMIAEGLYDGKLDFDFGPKLTKATEIWMQRNKDWITGKPLVVDLKVGPACWRSAMHMKGSQNGSKISFILREKFPGEHGTTCRFTQKVEKARGMYKVEIDDDNGNANQAGNVAYKTARGFKERSGKITVEMLKDMCGGC